MPSLNATLNAPTTYPIRNETFDLDTQFSSTWYNDQYMTYAVRILAVGGGLYAIRHIFWFKSLRAHEASRSLEGTFYSISHVYEDVTLRDHGSRG